MMSEQSGSTRLGDRMMNREAFLRRIGQAQQPWDIAIVGGGATGAGIALDAAARGYEVVLLERSDFGKGTSSRSTKLVHGGVRYLQQGNVSLVMEALKERGLLLRNAPHLVHDLPFVVPNYQWWETPFYGIGLKVYDMLAGKYGFGQSILLSPEEVLARIPTLQRDGLRGGVLYHDGQFDDTRLLLNLVQTAAEKGACVLNYASVIQLIKNGDGMIAGLKFRDEETGLESVLRARCVVNASGPFCDELRIMDDPQAERIISPSQGVHIVLDRSFLPGETAIMVPHTRDGRVMFAIPWHGHAVVGTTDTPIQQTTVEPQPLAGEILAEQALTERDRLHARHAVDTGCPPDLLGCLDDEGAGFAIELVRVSLEPAPRGFLEREGERIEEPPRAQPDIATASAFDFGLKYVGMA